MYPRFCILPQGSPERAKGFRYRLEADYQHVVPVSGQPPDYQGLYVGLAHIPGTGGSVLTARSGYAWDGPSGPTLDTVDFLRGSLIHDCLYQLIREGVLKPGDRATADRVLREVSAEDGMPGFRRWLDWAGLRLFGWAAARPGGEPKKHRPT